MNAQLTGFIDEKLVRNLDEQTGTIAGVRLRAYGSPVFHPPKHLERIRYDLVRFTPLDMGHKANTAVVVFKLGAIKARQLVNLIRHGRNSVG
ncbi:hypothetical protein GCM10028773_18190 [Spirosoma koreense]